MLGVSMTGMNGGFMAIDDPQAVRYCNEQVRVTADLMMSLYETCKRLKLNWDAHMLSQLIPNDNSPIEDGSATDGRPPITGAMVNNIINRAWEFTQDYEAGGDAKLMTVAQVAVNGESAF